MKSSSGGDRSHQDKLRTKSEDSLSVVNLSLTRIWSSVLQTQKLDCLILLLADPYGGGEGGRINF